ncbi:MAG: serine protein kinase RIO [Nanoarchaeota archaeon]|nr:serine protein kinase RIO [Nanoarchaeota archaeon]
MAKFKKNLSAKEKFKAYENVFDDSTLRAIYKLSCQKYFDELKGTVKIGKEANVFFALKGNKKVIVKIYRKSSNFKKMFFYMASDPRFAGLKRNKMNIIQTWAKKEYRNLMKARSAGIKVPSPHVAYKNMVVMDFIGNGGPAKQLNKQKPLEPQKFYEKLIKSLKDLYHKANLVHADISEFNILNLDEEPIMIDFSHAVTLKYPNAKGLLERDIKNLVRFFNKQGLRLNAEEELKKCLNKN